MPDKETLSLPSQERLCELLSYDKESGILRWRMKRGSKLAGAEAGCRDETTGYLRLRIDRVAYWAHRVIWKMMTGFDPVALVDHKDRDNANNSWGNLREANKADNQRNCKNHSTNTSGAKGIRLENGKWRAKISLNNKTIHIGSFDSLADAVRARSEVAMRLHGEFARGG